MLRVLVEQAVLDIQLLSFHRESPSLFEVSLFEGFASESDQLCGLSFRSLEPAAFESAAEAGASESAQPALGVRWISAKVSDGPIGAGGLLLGQFCQDVFRTNVEIPVLDFGRTGLLDLLPSGSPVRRGGYLREPRSGGPGRRRADRRWFLPACTFRPPDSLWRAGHRPRSRSLNQGEQLRWGLLVSLEGDLDWRDILSATVASRWASRCPRSGGPGEPAASGLSTRRRFTSDGLADLALLPVAGELVLYRSKGFEPASGS